MIELWMTVLIGCCIVEFICGMFFLYTIHVLSVYIDKLEKALKTKQDKEDRDLYDWALVDKYRKL